MDVEKVIKGLECCTKKLCIYKDTEKECPYSELCGDYEEAFEDCTTALSKDALALLKAQEARVIKVAKYDDEIQSPGMDCFTWIEEREREDVYIGAVNRTSHNNYGDEIYSFIRFWGKSKDGIKFEDYGKTWRCWTSRPDQATREAVKWE